MELTIVCVKKLFLHIFEHNGIFNKKQKVVPRSYHHLYQIRYSKYGFHSGKIVLCRQYYMELTINFVKKKEIKKKKKKLLVYIKKLLYVAIITCTKYGTQNINTILVK